MPLNIKDQETERLAREVAMLTGESKTGAIRTALRERKRRLRMSGQGQGRAERVRAYLERDVWPHLPADVRGEPLTKEEEEEILGLGPQGT